MGKYLLGIRKYEFRRKHTRFYKVLAGPTLFHGCDIWVFNRKCRIRILPARINSLTTIKICNWLGEIVNNYNTEDLNIFPIRQNII